MKVKEQGKELVDVGIVNLQAAKWEVYHMMGTTRPAVFVTETLDQFADNKFDVLDRESIRKGVTRGTALAREAQKVAGTISPAEVLEGMQRLMPEVFEEITKQFGQEELVNVTQAILSSFSRRSIREPRSFNEEDNGEGLMSLIKQSLKNAFGNEPVLVTPDGILVKPSDAFSQHAQIQAGIDDFKDIVTDEIQSQKIKPLIMASIVLAASTYFSLKFIASGVGFPGWEGWAAGALINSWESFGLDWILTEPGGPTKGDLVATAAKRKRMKATIQKMIIASIPIAYLLDFGFTLAGEFEKYPMSSIDGGWTKAVAILARIAIAGIVAGGPEIALNTVSRYLREIFRPAPNVPYPSVRPLGDETTRDYTPADSLHPVSSLGRPAPKPMTQASFSSPQPKPTYHFNRPPPTP